MRSELPAARCTPRRRLAIAVQAVGCALICAHGWTEPAVAETAGVLSPALVAAAQAEGRLAVLGIGADWCGYGKLIEQFTARYGISVVEVAPGSNPAEAAKLLAQGAHGGATARPDVVDMRLGDASAAKSQGLLQPYRISAWDAMPPAQKDPDAHWTAAYYAAMSFEVNARKVAEIPRDWAALLAPQYRNSVAIAGEPHRSNEALQAIYAAGVPAANSPGAATALAGLAFFEALEKNLNFNSMIGDGVSVGEGSTPVLLRWDYNALRDRDRSSAKGRRIEVVVPASGTAASVFVQAIAAQAAHPNAARLWLEYLRSDEGQLGWLRGYCHPVGFLDLVKAGKVPAELLARLPAAEPYEKVVFPTADEQWQARATIVEKWGIHFGPESLKRLETLAPAAPVPASPLPRYRLVLADGTELVGNLLSAVKLRTASGEVDVPNTGIASFRDGTLSLSDGTVLSGTLQASMSTTLLILTASGTVAVRPDLIVAIERP